ncbi:MAG TPA: sodium/proton-translocating pyrophosphatase, partial [bacterium]|nr:sodium/proton-translocating pyrophosphatase [bacterium]
VIDITNAKVVAGLFIGGMLTYFFTANTMEAVGKAAASLITEIRRQFREITGLMEGTAKPEYARCVDISTKAALKEMIIPGLIAVIVPLVVG